MKYILFFSFFCVFGYTQTRVGEQDFENSRKYVEKKEFGKALEYIEAALKTDASNRSYLMQKIKVLFLKSDCDASLALLQDLMQKEGVKDDTMFYFCSIGDCLKESDTATEGLMEYVKSGKYTGHDVLVLLAQRLYYASRYDESIQYYSDYLKLEPKDTQAIIDMSRIVYAYKGKSAGLDVINEAVKKYPDNVELLTCLSAYYYNEKSYNKALDVVNKLIEMDSNEKSILSRAMIYTQLGMKDSAYKDYKTLLRLKDCVADYYSMTLQYEFDNRMYEENIISSYNLIACNSSYKDAVLDGLYTSLFFCNDFKKGKEYLDEKLASNPDNFNPYSLKVLMLFKDKQYNEIPKYLDLAMKTKDITDNDIANVGVLKMAYYLITEDYGNFAASWNINNDKKTLENNISFSVIEEPIGEKTEFRSVFDKNSGIIKSSLVIPSKIVRLLVDKYNLKIDLKKK